MHWMVTGVALITAGVALLRARRLSRRLERLSESYWELRYEYGQLRARVSDLEGSGPARLPAPGDVDAIAGRPGQPPVAFVPLSSLKR